jgi:C1A family cysteine protease
MVHLATMALEMPPTTSDFPPAWDWRNLAGTDWTTSVRDQQACGACVAFAAVAVMETMLKRHYGNASLQPDLSEAHLFFCGCGNCCNQGWWPTYALNYAQRSGVPSEVCFPYQGRDLSCSESCVDWSDGAVKVVSWQEVLETGARKEWLANRGPMIGCMAIYRDFFSYLDGVYRHTLGDLVGYHAVCVVGYSESDQAWICKNSWGTEWGQAGWFRIGYHECGIDTQFAMYGVDAVVPAAPVPGPDPEPPPAPGCNLPVRVAAALRRDRHK